MPSRNTLRLNVSDSYYHAYVRGASKQPIFLDRNDKQYFLQLFARYLSDKPAKNKEGFYYLHFKGKIELSAYCLMDNHLHLLVYQNQKNSLAQFMKSLLSSYCRYFNLRYRRSGSIFESRYKASLITNDSYLLHISRYIHLNPRNWKRFEFSSINYFKKGDEPEWLSTDKVLAQYTDRKSYVEFLNDYEDYRDMLAAIKHDLADK